MPMSKISRLFLYKRHRAFVELFDPENPQARRFLAWLKDFCNTPEVFSNKENKLFHENPQEMARRVGRYEVYAEIMKYINLPDKKVAELREE